MEAVQLAYVHIIDMDTKRLTLSPLRGIGDPRHTAVSSCVLRDSSFSVPTYADFFVAPQTSQRETSYSEWTKSCTTLISWETTACWYLQGNHHSRVPQVMRNGFRPSTVSHPVFESAPFNRRHQATLDDEAFALCTRHHGLCVRAGISVLSLASLRRFEELFLGLGGSQAGLSLLWF